MREQFQAFVGGCVAVLLLSGCTSWQACKARSKAKEAASAAAAETLEPSAVSVAAEIRPGDPVIVVESMPVPVAPQVKPASRVRRPSPTFSRSGFHVFEEDGRLWVLREGSEELQEFLAYGEPAKSVTLIGAGPGGRTVRAPDKATIEAWKGAFGIVAGRSTAFGRPGFDVFERDGRLWVFAAGSKALEAFLAHGEPAVRVTQVGAGPEGRTLIGPSRDVLESYQAATRYGAPGFAVFQDEGRLWVFRDGTDDMKEYLSFGEPAKSVTLIGVGPDGQSVRAPDRETVDAWLAMIR